MTGEEMSRVTAYIAAAVRAKFHPDAKMLKNTYEAAKNERWRKDLTDDWKPIHNEGWPMWTPSRGMSQADFESTKKSTE